MQDLISIEKNNINGKLIQTVNARDLHVFLESKQDFSTWIKKRIDDYGFIENQDFIRFHKKMEANNATVIEYYITIDMAKELSMVERNEKGKQARRYFIECEKKALQPQYLLPQTLPEALRLAADLAEENQKLETENNNLKNLFKEGMTTTQFCKMLNGVNVQKINNFLYLHNWLYNESKSGKNLRWRATSYARDRYLTEKQNEFNLHGEEAFIKFQPVLLQKGAQKIYQHYLANELPMKKSWDGLHTHDKSVRVAA